MGDSSSITITANKIQRYQDINTICDLAYTLLRKTDCERNNSCHTCTGTNRCKQTFHATLHRHICPPQGLITAYKGCAIAGYALHTPISHKDVPFYSKAAQGVGISIDARSQVLHSIAVDPQHQKAGIGLQMLRCAVEDARSQGATQLFAQCIGTETDPSCKLFVKAGFDPIDTYESHFLDKSSCVIVYKPLN
jgi:GNAT superfamily N-acetyltransferase